MNKKQKQTLGNNIVMCFLGLLLTIILLSILVSTNVIIIQSEGITATFISSRLNIFGFIIIIAIILLISNLKSKK